MHSYTHRKTHTEHQTFSLLILIKTGLITQRSIIQALNIYIDTYTHTYMHTNIYIIFINIKKQGLIIYGNIDFMNVIFT